MNYEFSIGQRILLRDKASHVWEEGYFSLHDSHDILKLKEEILPVVTET